MKYLVFTVLFVLALACSAWATVEDSDSATVTLDVVQWWDVNLNVDSLVFTNEDGASTASCDTDATLSGDSNGPFTVSGTWAPTGDLAGTSMNFTGSDTVVYYLDDASLFTGNNSPNSISIVSWELTGVSTSLSAGTHSGGTVTFNIS